MTTKVCSQCGADQTHLMPLDDGSIYCDVHRGLAVPAVETPDLAVVDADNEQGRAVTHAPRIEGADIESAEAAAYHANLEALEEDELSEDAQTAGVPLGIRIGVITGAAILLSTFDIDADELAAMLKAGPAAIGGESENPDVVLRAGVAVGIATWIDVFDIDVDEIQVMSETLLQSGDEQKEVHA